MGLIHVLDRFRTRRPATGRRRAPLVAAAALALLAPLVGVAVAPTASAAAGDPNLGPNVKIFDPSMPVSQIQATVDAIAAQQIGNQFGSERYALLFKPGTYGSATEPLNFQVGYYTTVAGLGLSPNDVVINGSVYVRNQCESANFCIALNNFWRSLQNLTINVTTPGFGCYGSEFWAVSQAAPMRRVHVVGQTTLMDFCTGPSFASGGFIADSLFEGGVLINGSQQQWVTRNSSVQTWTNGVWNQVFAGVTGAPAQCFPADPACGGPYTTLATASVSREAPYLYVDAKGAWNVRVPSVRRNSTGTSWAAGTTPGTSIPLSRFVIARPGADIGKINDQLEQGRHLLLTPGVYSLPKALKVERPNTVVLGVGFPTLVPSRGNAAVTVDDGPGVQLAGMIVDAGPVNSPLLMQIGSRGKHRDFAGNPVGLSDVFFRIGGAAAGKATVSLEVNSDDTLLDDIWAWRADHGNGVGWTVNTADTGVIVNGDDVTAHGLFVEHYQKTETIWNGQNGTVVFFQNEMPYDPPSQAAWSPAKGVNGYPALKVADTVKTFRGYGMGSYSFFNQGIDIFADHAFEVPTTLPKGSLTDLLTIFLDPNNGKGGITHVVNDTGGSSTIANPDVVVPVVSYP